MRSTQVLALAGLVLAGKFAMAAKLEHDDVPNICWDACGPVVGQASECDARHDKDRAELDCICKWESAKTQIPLCAACISKYDRDHDHDHDHDDDHDDDDHDNDALDIVHSCSFTTTSYNSAAATTLSGSATGTATASTSASTTGGASSGSGSGGGSGSSGSEAASSTPTTDAAAGLSAPGTISMAAFVGLLPLAWL